METTQRDAFFGKLFELAKEDKRIIVVTADCGCPSLDRWYEELPNQIINVGIAEQQMIALASGLALEGKRPYCYAIAPFASLRCYEFIRVDVSMMNLPIVIVGVGAGLSYTEAGPTHHATEDIACMRALPNIKIASVSSNDQIDEVLVTEGPMYVRLDRGGGEYAPHIIFEPNGEKWYPLWLKPFTMPTPRWARGITTVEEHQLNGGLGSIVAEYLKDENIRFPLKRIGIKDEYYYKYGSREDITVQV
jgi:transketolase